MTLEVINKKLNDHYGRFEDGRPNWRVVFSDDEYEIRHGIFPKYTEYGVWLSNETGYRQVPKYSYNKHQYVLERLIPVIGNEELITKTSYEPVWFFHDKDNNPLPPKWEVCHLVIETVYKAAAKAVGAKYPDPDLGLLPDEQKSKKRAEIDELEMELFGNETRTGDSLAHKEAIVVPGLSINQEVGEKS